MFKRREFLKHTVGAASAALLPTSAIPATGLRIRSAIRRDETTLHLGGHGDNFHMSWAADNRQLCSVNDGYGWLDKGEGLINTSLWAIGGDPRHATFTNLAGYPARILAPADPDPRYYGFGTLAIDGRIYQFLSTYNAGPTSDGSLPPNFRFAGAKLIYSPDNGRTWCNQDGSAPVVRERTEQRSRENMVFFKEDHDAFSLLSVLQMGRNYEANRDRYVYVYAPNGNGEGRMNELVMFRVLKDQILNRNVYEFFGGLRRDGNATWVKDIDAREVVHHFPRGWVNTTDHPWAWMPSVTFNAPLELYMMTSWGMGAASNGKWFGKPSYVGLWVAVNPWGPWEQIYEETAWTPRGDARARAYSPQIAPKWIAVDGKSFWLVWTEYQGPGKDKWEKSPSEDELRKMKPDERARLRVKIARNVQPHYAFNTQRVDLIVS